MRIGILLVDEQVLVRQGLRGLLERHPEYQVLGEARNGDEGIRLAEQLAPHIVLMDLLSIPHLDGIAATRHIRARSACSKVIGVSGCTDRQVIARLQAAGAVAYVPKHRPFTELCHTINLVHGQRASRAPAAHAAVHSGVLVHQFHTHGLTECQTRVLQLMGEGKTSKEIAAMLQVSEKAVEALRHRIRLKTRSTNVADMILCAVREGLVKVDDPAKNFSACRVFPTSEPLPGLVCSATVKIKINRS